MTDDDAFVRRVVDSPGDDTPRLVYADWLDDRADARGAYLRAEVANPGIAHPADGLDPVWVARVARPPAGVCCDHVRFDCMGVGPGPPLTAADLDRFEQEHDAALPPQYRAFLLNRNGGYPYPERIEEPEGDPEEWPVIEAFSMIAPAGWQERPGDRMPGRIYGADPDPFGQLGRLLPIADDGGISGVYLGLDGVYAGRVFRHADPVHAWDEFPVRPLAGSLGELLGRLATPDPAWAQAIIRGDVPALTAWLDAGGDPNEEYPENEWHLLEHAVQWGHRAMVRLLLDRGAEVNQTAWQVADGSDDAEIKAMVKAVCPTNPGRPRRRR